MLYDGGFLARLEDGVRGALSRWDIAPTTELKLLTISENATFRASNTGTGGDLVFRVHRPDYHTRREIESELAWIDALRAEGGILTPRPIPLRDGSLIADIEDAGTPRHVVAFEFLPGKEPDEKDDLVGWFAKLGTIHAGLHAQARAWTRPEGFTRKVWNFRSMLGDQPLWGDWRAGLGLTGEGRAILEKTALVLERELAAIGTEGDSFGLVHADLRLANLLVDGDKLALIDFDDCGFSWFLYDFAAAISFIEHEPYVPALMDAWIAGYRTRLPLTDAQAAQLPVFIMLRRMLLTAWIASHAETPTAQAMGIPYTDGTIALAEAFLSARA
ncbi:MAG TPA: phosphotransferase [Xanthobacteraceae bacterium]|nr:phosphotransferase [Xanthobacteraceae bacterium]